MANTKDQSKDLNNKTIPKIARKNKCQEKAKQEIWKIEHKLLMNPTETKKKKKGKKREKNQEINNKRSFWVYLHCGKSETVQKMG